MISSMSSSAIYNGRLYASTGDYGKVLVFDGAA
jgi:hypothetical protein